MPIIHETPIAKVRRKSDDLDHYKVYDENNTRLAKIEFSDNAVTEEILLAILLDRQKRKGSLGGKKSKRGAKANSERSTKPWEAMGISRATYYRRQNKPQK
jgi:hypothetical protein